MNKKVWRKPEVKRIAAGSAEQGQSGPGDSKSTTKS
jgi:hypothetical protein